jgi:uncharacterized protein YaaN involved in tellurite resistance
MFPEWVMLAVSATALVLSGTASVFAILIFMKDKNRDIATERLENALDHLKGLFGHVDASTASLRPLLQQVSPTLDKHAKGLEKGVKDILGRYDKSISNLAERFQEVEGHMSVYRTVLKSQDQLIAGIAELTTYLDDTSGRRHR